MWFSVVWALANCSNFALHPALTGLESTVSRHPLLLLHQFIPMFIPYKQSMRQAAETSEAALASIAFCAWLSARATWASKVLSFIGNNGWESALTLRFWMGLGPFLAYLSMLANNEWPSLPILARIQLSTAGLEFVEGRGLEQKGTVLLGKQKGYNQMTTSSYFFVCGWMGSMTVNVLQEWMCYQHIHKSSLKSKTYGCFPSNTLKLICSQTVRGSWRHKFSWSWKWQAWSYAKSRLWPLGLGSNTLRTQHFLERRSKHW